MPHFDPPPGFVIATLPAGWAGTARLAAACEAEPARWQARFAGLLERGIVRPLTGQGTDPERFAAQFGLALDAADRDCNELIRALVPLLGQGAAVAIDLPAAAADRQLPALLGRAVDQRLTPLALRPLNLSFVLRPAHDGLPLARALGSSRQLGYPLVVLRLPDCLRAALIEDGPWRDGAGRAGAAAALWETLTMASWTTPAIQLTLAGTSRPASELCPAEPVATVLPDSLFEVPPVTAWLSLRLDLAALAAVVPQAQWWRELRRSTRLALHLADNLLDQLPWPGARFRSDALQSRRIAVHVTGIGALLDHLRLDPRQVTTLRQVEGWLATVRQVLRHESRRLARQRGAFPALRLAAMADTLSGRYGPGYARHFLGRRILRHRHLLLLSPFALLPAGGSRYPAASYFDLLPALRHADSIGLYGSALRHRLGLEDYRRLLRMTWATARNR